MKKYQPEGLILAVGMRDLKDGFSGIENISKSRFLRIVERILNRIGVKRIEYAAKTLRILTMVEEIKSPSGLNFGVTTGLLKNQIYFKAGYFQSEAMVDKAVARDISLQRQYTDSAEQFLSIFPGDQENRFFVHVRRGDYINWPSCSAPAVLPLDWYRTQMNLIRNKNSNARFIIVSDDKPYVDEFFSEESDVVISNGNTMNDFSVMTKCFGGGILSASSLSWWASYFVHRETDKALFIAPIYWAGHRLGSWYPEQIKTSWINYVQVRMNE